MWFFVASLDGSHIGSITLLYVVYEFGDNFFKFRLALSIQYYLFNKLKSETV